MDDVFNKVFRRVTIVSTSLGKANEVNANVEGVSGETDDGILYGSIGIIANPLPQNADGAATGIAAVGSDQLDTIAAFDRRLTEARGPLPVGALSLPGYRGQHVTTEDAATPTYGKVTIEAGGARITIEDSLLGPTIKVVRDGPPSVSVTIGPTNTVDVVRAGVAENVALYAASQNFVTELCGLVDLLCVGQPLAAEPIPVGILPALITASAIPEPLKSYMITAIATSYGHVSDAAVIVTNPALASSAVLRASPL